jgi:NTP pyrophosphatase (non-canonical NTP hydrolase)
MSKTLNQIAEEVHTNAVAKGFYRPGETEDEFIERACNNLHDEVSELHEAWRNNRLHELCDKAQDMEAIGIPPLTCAEEELADVIIRAADNARHLNIDVDYAVERKQLFNKSRPYKHGGKRS